MNKVLIAVATFVVFISEPAQSQSQLYDSAMEAYKQDNLNGAYRLFGEALEQEKYYMAGKDIGWAYYYRANIGYTNLNNIFKTKGLVGIYQNPSLIVTILSDLENAIQFQSSKNTILVDELKNTTLSKCLEIGQSVSDSLLHSYKRDAFNDTAKPLASIVDEEFEYLAKFLPDWQEIYDVLGFSYYVLGEKDKALIAYKRAQLLHSESLHKSITYVHLYSYYYSCKIELEINKNYESANAIALSGKLFLKEMVTALNPDDFAIIKELALLESSFDAIPRRIIEMQKN